MFSFFLDLILKLSKSDCPEPETEPSRILSLAKFSHQQNIVRIVALPGSNDFQVFPNTAPPFKATLKLLKFYFIFWNYKIIIRADEELKAKVLLLLWRA
jgi:hypothetical protein